MNGTRPAEVPGGTCGAKRAERTFGPTRAPGRDTLWMWSGITPAKLNAPWSKAGDALSNAVLADVPPTMRARKNSMSVGAPLILPTLLNTSTRRAAMSITSILLDFERARPPRGQVRFARHGRPRPLPHGWSVPTPPVASAASQVNGRRSVCWPRLIGSQHVAVSRRFGQRNGIVGHGGRHHHLLPGQGLRQPRGAVARREHGSSVAENQTPELAKHFRIIAPDTKAHGRNTVSDRPLNFDVFACDVLGLVAEPGIGRASFIGFSDGGFGGLLLG